MRTIDLCQALLNEIREAELAGVSSDEVACLLSAIRNAYVEHAAGVPHSTILRHLEVWPDQQQIWMRSAIGVWSTWEGEHAVRSDSGTTDGV